jgi:hypothetical protein
MWPCAAVRGSGRDRWGSVLAKVSAPQNGRGPKGPARSRCGPERYCLSMFRIFAISADCEDTIPVAMVLASGNRPADCSVLAMVTAPS